MMGEQDRLSQLRLEDCMECGCCTYICPAHRPLTQAFKEMRKAVMAERKKKA